MPTIEAPRAARSLRERAAAAAATGTGLAGGVPPLDDALLARWREAATAGDPTLFALRQAVLKDALPDDPDPDCGWQEELAAALDRIGHHAAGADEEANVVLPLVLIAHDHLREAAARLERPPAPAVIDALVEEVRTSMLRRALPLLRHDIAIRRAQHAVREALAPELPLAGGAAAARATGSQAPTASVPAAQPVTTVAGESGAVHASTRAFLARHPVLARALVRMARAHAAAVGEMLHRFEVELPRLCRAFAGVTPDAEICAVSVALSDSHDGGRSVRVLRLSGGVRIVYKPRSCALERAYYRLERRVGRALPGRVPRAPVVLDRGSHGWMEHVAARPCRDADELECYFRSAGRLAAMAYVLAGSDLHAENVVAAGGRAVAVDLEMLFVPDTGVAESGLTGGSLQAHLGLKDSVLGTVVLPAWASLHFGVAVDFGGISGDASLFRPATGDGPSANLPRLAGVIARPADHEAALATGFAEVYRWFLHGRDALLGPAGPLASWSRLPVRFLNRPTMLYAKLLEEANRAECWRDGAARSLVFERMFRALHTVPPMLREAVALLIDHEVRALERDDVPCFRTRIGSHALTLPDGSELSGFFRHSGVDNVRARLLALSEADLTRQLGLIRIALALDTVNRAAGTGRASVPDAPAIAVAATPFLGAADAGWAEGSPPVPADAATLRAAAHEIGERLARSALRAAGSASWLAPHLLPGTFRYGFAPMAHGLYEGTGGVALFCAALYRVTGSGAAADFAREILAGVRDSVGTRLPGTADERIGVNAGTGLAGALYLLATAADLLDEPRLTRTASALVPRIARGVDHDRAFDLVSGSAGAILCLLAYHRRTRDDAALEVARRCGDHLLARGRPLDGGQLVWNTPAGVLTGLSHGSAGFALALGRLAAATGADRFAAAAASALRFERAHYLPDRRNWKDLRAGHADAEPMTTWCHGAPGIALSRLRLAHADDEVAREELEIALSTTAVHPLDALDHLCCGHIGRAEVLHTAGLRLGRPQLRARAFEAAGAVIRRAQREGGYRCFPTPTPGVEHPGLFQGIAGIGYGLLRLADPDAVPCLLLLE